MSRHLPARSGPGHARGGRATPEQARGGRLAERVALAAATAFLAINLWTGAPLLALWIGSKVVGQRALSMGAVFVVVLTLAVLLLAMTVALAWVNATYERVTGRSPRERRLAWLRSMNSTANPSGEDRRDVSAIELIVIASVYVAVIGLLVWFFVFAGSSLPG